MNKINDVNDLLDTLGTDKIITNPSYFGMGKIYKYAHDIGLTKLNENYERYAQDWGGDFTRDILIYTSKESNSYLKESLIQILNVWSQEFEMPFPLDNKDIDKMISNNDSRVEKYKFLDDLFSNNFVIKPFYR